MTTETQAKLADKILLVDIAARVEELENLRTYIYGARVWDYARNSYSVDVAEWCNKIERRISELKKEQQK
jgi:predicted transcriptional regulator